MHLRSSRWCSRQTRGLRCCDTADVAQAIKAALFPLRSQTPADLKAAAWGVLAWENPLAAKWGRAKLGQVSGRP